MNRNIDLNSSLNCSSSSTLHRVFRFCVLFGFVSLAYSQFHFHHSCNKRKVIDFTLDAPENFIATKEPPRRMATSLHFYFEDVLPLQ